MADPLDPVDRALHELDQSSNGKLDARPSTGGTNDRTIAGLGVGTPAPTANAAPANAASDPRLYLQSRARPPSDAPPALAHAEQSPLAFVMRAGEASESPKEPSHDMSMFVAGLVAETSPVVERAAEAPAMEPVMRRSRKRRNWIAASALGAMAIVGTIVGVHVAAKDEPPKIAASAPQSMPPPPPPAVAPSAPPPVAPPAPVAAAPQAANENVAPAAPADAAPPSTEIASPPVDVANVAKTHKPAPTAKAATKTSAAKVASKKVATSTSAKKASKKSSSTKSKKKKTARNSTSAKKKTTHR